MGTDVVRQERIEDVLKIAEGNELLEDCLTSSEFLRFRAKMPWRIFSPPNFSKLPYIAGETLMAGGRA